MTPDGAGGSGEETLLGLRVVADESVGIHERDFDGQVPEHHVQLLDAQAAGSQIHVGLVGGFREGGRWGPPTRWEALHEARWHCEVSGAERSDRGEGWPRIRGAPGKGSDGRGRRIPARLPLS